VQHSATQHNRKGGHFRNYGQAPFVCTDPIFRVGTGRCCGIFSVALFRVTPLSVALREVQLAFHIKLKTMCLICEDSLLYFYWIQNANSTSMAAGLLVQGQPWWFFQSCKHKCYKWSTMNILAFLNVKTMVEVLFAGPQLQMTSKSRLSKSCTRMLCDTRTK
jgi:hypothetical protein